MNEETLSSSSFQRVVEARAPRPIPDPGSASRASGTERAVFMLNKHFYLFIHRTVQLTQEICAVIFVTIQLFRLFY